MRLRATYKKLNNVATSIGPQAQPAPTTTGSTVNEIGGNAACSLPLCRRSLRLRGCRRRSGRRRHGRFRLLLHFLRIGRVKDIILRKYSFESSSRTTVALLRFKSSIERIKIEPNLVDPFLLRFVKDQLQADVQMRLGHAVVILLGRIARGAEIPDHLPALTLEPSLMPV